MRAGWGICESGSNDGSSQERFHDREADRRAQRVRRGLALYTPSGRLVGGIGLSGDTACTDHIIAWKLRHALNLDNVPAGAAPNIIYAVGTIDGFEHPKCFDASPAQGDHVAIANNLPTSHPVGPDE